MKTFEELIKEKAFDEWLMSDFRIFVEQIALKMLKNPQIRRLMEVEF